MLSRPPAFISSAPDQKYHGSSKSITWIALPGHGLALTRKGVGLACLALDFSR